MEEYLRQTLLTVILVVNTVRAADLWRYSHWNIASNDLLSFNTPVTLEHLYNNSVTWKSDGLTQNGSKVTFHFHSPGLHEIQLNFENETDSHIIWIPLENSPYCYTWETSYTYEMVGKSIGISLWVSDYTAANSLSDQFQLLGEYPTILLLTSIKEAVIKDIGYNRECSCWKFQVTAPQSLPHVITYEIKGRGVNVMNCGIRPTQFIATKPKYELDNMLQLTSPTEIYEANYKSHLYQDSVLPSVAVVTYGAMNIITQDGFKTHSSFQILENSGRIKGVSFTSDAMSVLIGGNIMTLTNGNSDVIHATGLPYLGVDEVTGRGQHPDYGNEDIIVGWSHEASSIYMSIDGGRQFSIVFLEDDYYIHSLKVHPMKDQLTLLISVNETSVRFIKYEVFSETWTTGGNVFQYRGGQLSFQYFPTSYGDMLIWGDQELFYCSNEGDVMQSIESISRQDGAIHQHSFAEEEHFTTAITGRLGQFALLTSTKALHYGRVSAGKTIKLPMFVSNSTFLFFDNLGNLKVNNDEEFLSVNVVPLYSLLLSTLYPPNGCPHIQWKTNIKSGGVYFIDRNEIIQLWAVVVPRQWASNEISLAVSHQNVVSWEENVQEEQTAVQGVVKRNMSISVQSHSEAQNNSSTVLKLSPSSQTLSCSQSAEVQAEILSTCPPLRHIRLKRNEDEQCSKYYDYTYTISKDHYDPEFKGRKSRKASKDKRVTYHVSEWGCPIQLPFNEKYKPTLQLYDENSFNQEVTGDFILREIHGRTDYGYNATAKDAKCVRTPQRWSDMLSEVDTPHLAWTMENYQSCHQQGVEEMRDISYEIMNNTGVSAIEWGDHDGIYVFTATIIDKEYSFCNLSIIFAVEVYGATTKSYIGYVLLLLTCLLSAVGLIFSYFGYRHLVKSGRLSKSD